MLNDADGVEVCKLLRESEKYSNIPIIMLTAKSDEIDKIIGLEIGADDYMTKPFSPRELIARIKAILRRAEKHEKKEEIIAIKDLEVNLSKHEVRIKKEKINLTQTEFKVLKLLIERKGWVCSREQLLNYLWGDDKIVIERTIDVHVKNLREKLKDHKDLIKNIRGVGYKIEL
jgi:two-component system phosphate regulon response regulator PhoB/two-component system alkaline phosphatase synthesis response regulator PhoP